MLKNFNLNRFTFWNWKAQCFKNSEDLVRFFHKQKIIGKRIRNVRVIGDIEHSQSNLSFAATEPLIIELDDDRHLEMICDCYGYCHIAFDSIPNDVKDGMNDYRIDLHKNIQKSFAGKTIEDIADQQYNDSFMNQEDRSLKLTLTLKDKEEFITLLVENDPSSSTYFCSFEKNAAFLENDRPLNIVLYDGADYFDIGCNFGKCEASDISFYLQEDDFHEHLLPFLFDKTKNSTGFELWGSPNYYDYFDFLKILAEIEKSIIDTNTPEDNYKARFIFYARKLLEHYPSNSEVYVRGP